MILSFHLLLLALKVSCQNDYHGMIQNGMRFLKSNGLKYISLVSFNRNLLKEHYYGAWKSAMNESLYFRDNYTTILDTDSFLILSTAQEVTEEPLPIIRFISNQIRRRCLLVILKSGGDESNDADLISSLSTQSHSLNRNVMFYVQIKGLWISMIKVKNTEKTVVNYLNLTTNLSVIDRDWDLQGITVKSISLTWMPDYGLDSCTPGIPCNNVTGILASIFKSVAAITNVTIEHILEPNLDWGMEPKSGPYNSTSSEWAGAMGSVVSGKYPLSLSQWINNPQRKEISEILSCYTDRPVLAVVNRPPEIDLGLFIRPFRNEAWMATIALTVGLIVLMLVPFLWNSNYDKADSCVIMQTSGWYFFLLFNAFYGGALTMFFTSKPDLPFSDIRQVMQAYPEWRLLMKEHFNAYFSVLAEQGDPDYKTFYDRVTANSSDAVYATMEEGIESLTNDRVVLHITDVILYHYFVGKATVPGMHIFSQGKPQVKGPMITKNSPLGPVFRTALSHLNEQGTIYKAMREFQGTKPKSSDSETLVLTAGQTLLVFILIGAGGIVAMLVLGMEHVFRKCNFKIDFLSGDLSSTAIEKSPPDSPILQRLFLTTAQVEDRLYKRLKRKRQ